MSIFGVGIAEGGLKGSGYPQYARTSMGGTRLQKLNGELPVYDDIAGERSAAAHIPYTGGDKKPSTGWRSEFPDFINDRLLDQLISNLGWVHVRLGTAERVEIRVQWPDGEWSYQYRPFANQFVVVDRTRPQPDYWYPGR